MRTLAIIAITLLSAGCVGKELRKVAEISASEAHNFKRDFANFDQANRYLIERRYAQISFDELGSTDAQSKIDYAESMLRTGNPADLSIYQAATPSWQTLIEPEFIPTPARWDQGPQDVFLESLQKAAKPRTSGQNVKFLLRLLKDFAQISAKPVADQAASTEKEANGLGK